MSDYPEEYRHEVVLRCPKCWAKERNSVHFWGWDRLPPIILHGTEYVSPERYVYGRYSTVHCTCKFDYEEYERESQLAQEIEKLIKASGLYKET